MSGPRIRVCITGPECTGKTTLAVRLATWQHAALVPEAARLYAERQHRALHASDVTPIAREHVALSDAARGPLVVLDTDLISTVIYSRHYYGMVPPWIEGAERARRADLYLLCDVDVPWEPDGVRDRPVQREQMFALFRRALLRRKAHTVLVRGDWERRWEVAREAVERLTEVSSRRSERSERVTGSAVPR